jgi:hypothetical protein
MRHPPRPAHLILALATALLAAGCATVEKDKRAIALYKATTGYESAIRWGYFQNAFGYLHPDKRKDQELPERFAELRVVGYDAVQSPVVQPTKDKAVQIVTIGYLYEDRQVVKQLTDTQLWEWDEQAGSWWLTSGLPAFE